MDAGATVSAHNSSLGVGVTFPLQANVVADTRLTMSQSPRGTGQPWGASALAAGALGVLGRPDAAQAEAAHDTAGVQCVVQSASLNFGRLNPQRSPWVVGEGAARVACQNNTPEVRRVTLSVAFPGLGPQTAVLQSGHSALAVAFYQDARHTVRWGDDRNGAGALHLELELTPGERK